VSSANFQVPHQLQNTLDNNIQITPVHQFPLLLHPVQHPMIRVFGGKVTKKIEKQSKELSCAPS